MTAIKYAVGAIVVILIVIGSIGSISTCYSEHRNRGYSITTSLTACSS